MEQKRDAHRSFPGFMVHRPDLERACGAGMVPTTLPLRSLTVDTAQFCRWRICIIPYNIRAAFDVITLKYVLAVPTG
jgi:hypothetical protein